MPPSPSLTPPVAVPPPVDEFERRFLLAWQSLEAPPGCRRLLVAVSGGPDSLALLHLLHETRHRHGLDLIVAHVDHGIHPASAAVARRVVQEAELLAWPAVVGRLTLGAGTSETRARTARHEWLERTRRAEGADAIVLAHHRDDQVETVLLRVLAGSGPAGLAGMLPRRGRLLRPLLGFRRSELGQYLAARGVEAWADPANDDPAHRRSWVRTALLPRITEAAPDIGDRLVELASQARGDRGAWDAALEVIPGLDAHVEPDRISVAALPLAGYDSDLAIALLQAAARRVGCVLGPRRGARLLDLLRGGQSGRVLELGAGWRGELSFGRLCFYRTRSTPPALDVGAAHGEACWGEWRLRWTREPAAAPPRRDGWTAWFIGQTAVVRGPRAGDRLRPLGGSGSRSVSRLLQEARIPRSRRAGWPLVELDGEVQWVAGVCRGEGGVPSMGEDGLRIEVRHG